MIELARQLGEALKESAEYKAFCETRTAMRENGELKAKLDEFKIQKGVLDFERQSKSRTSI